MPGYLQCHQWPLVAYMWHLWCLSRFGFDNLDISAHLYKTRHRSCVCQKHLNSRKKLSVSIFSNWIIFSKDPEASDLELRGQLWVEMFRSSASFDRLLERATSNLLLEPDWDAVLNICDTIRYLPVLERAQKFGASGFVFRPRPFQNLALSSSVFYNLQLSFL